MSGSLVSYCGTSRYSEQWCQRVENVPARAVSACMIDNDHKIMHEPDKGSFLTIVILVDIDSHTYLLLPGTV